MTKLIPLAHTINDACTMSGLSRSTLYEAIKNGQLKAIKCGARTLIRHEELTGFLDGLPQLGTADAA